MMKKRRSSRKLFYPVGLLALSVFPVFGFQKIAEKYSRVTAPTYTRELLWGASEESHFFKALDPEIQNNLRKYQFESYSKSRVFKPFILTSDSEKNKKILYQGKLFLIRIKSQDDSVNGVHFIINDSTPYQDFITAIDICLAEFPGLAMPYKGNIWASHAFVDTSWYAEERLNRLEETKSGIGRKY